MEQGHQIHAIRRVEVIGPHALRLTFEDGFRRDVDLSDVLYGSRFGPLRDPACFAQVRLNTELETIEWPTGADFDPETLYNWDRYAEQMRAVARSWQKHS